MSRTHPHRLERALELIEQRLGEPVGLADIAAAAYLSPFHFARIFRAVCGDSVMSYVCKRRLNTAVLMLRDQLHSSVLDIAIACGFGSNEAFTRAFRREYGMAPSTYRRNRHTLSLPIHRRLILTDMNWRTPPAPTFVDVPAFLAMGMADEFQPGQTQSIGALWQRFGPVMPSIHKRVGTHTYGICCPLEEARESDRFSYIAAVQVTDLVDLPAGMTGVNVPAHRCAVFSHQHGIGPALARTFRYVFGEWLPASGCTLLSPDYEYYDHRFDPFTGTGEFFIHVPIQWLE